MAKFQILEKLAEGGMGEVYRARHVSLGREVALKTMIAADFAEEKHLQRFQREIKLLSSLTHPHIVRVFESGMMDGKPYFTMELISGNDLERVLANGGPMAPARAMTLMAQLAGAVAHLHEHDITHRDVKPKNAILVRKEEKDHLILVDFGLARAAPGTMTTRSGELLGTLPYLAPEILREEEGGPPQDVWALALTTHQLLTGRTLVERSGVAAVMEQILRMDPGIIAKELKGSPPWLIDLLSECLSADPAKRPTASDFHHRISSGRFESSGSVGRGRAKVSMRTASVII